MSTIASELPRLTRLELSAVRHRHNFSTTSSLRSRCHATRNGRPSVTVTLDTMTGMEWNARNELTSFAKKSVKVSGQDIRVAIKSQSRHRDG